MRAILTLTLLLSTHFLFAQSLEEDNSTETRALIIGIADYRDSLIGDLHFANRDAEIFADYLKSEEGGRLPDVNIWTMTNKEATLGAIDNALDWLIKETKKGDKVIIYFSGHGDVERRTLWQRGYLLVYNTPANNYRNNAVRVEELDEIIKTLSVGNEAKVIVILDACRSGKLATAGPSLTAEQLEKQVENEVRILSCKHDQKSLESEIWGGGRGLFSYYLVNGMKGLADKGDAPDKVVTFDELRDYIKANMDKELSAPEVTARQNPVFVGDETFELAKVRPEMLAEAAREMGLASASNNDAARNKGFGEKGPTNNPAADLTVAFQGVDFSERVLNPEFENVLATNDPAALLQFFTQNLDTLPKPDDAALRQQAQLALAARLHDQAQEVINLYLLGDAQTLDQRSYIDQAEKYVQYPRMLQAALVLLPQGHLLRRNAEVKWHYFDGVCTRLASQMSDDPMSRIPEAIEKQKKALALDDKAAYIHNEMGQLYLMQKDLKAARKEFELAAELAPDWALPQSNLCGLLVKTKEYVASAEYGNKAMELQPDYFATYVNLGYLAEKQHDLLKAETLYRKARALNDPHYIPFERRAYLQLESGRYEEAEWQFHEMELRKKGMVPINDGILIFNPFYPVIPIEFEYPSLSGPGVLNNNPRSAEDYFMTGKYFYENNQLEQAETNFKKAMRLNANHLEVYYYLGKICQAGQRFGEAEVYFQRLVKLRPEVEFMPFYLAEVYRIWQRPKEEEAIYRHFIESSKTSDVLRNAYLWLDELLNKNGRFVEEELLLWEFQKIMPEDASSCLTLLYSRMENKYPNDPDWKYRSANFFYSQGEHEEGIRKFEAVVALDSNYAARAFIHTKAGEYYLYEGRKPRFSETDSLWRGQLPQAIAHLEKAVALAPQLPNAKYQLVTAYLRLFMYEGALATLESLRDSNDLDFNSHLQLADLYTRSGRFDEAKVLLDKAWDIQPEAVKWLPELSGLANMLQGKNQEAIKYYQQELALHGESAKGELFYTIARLYARQGDKRQALNWLQLTCDRLFRFKLVVKYDPDWDKYRADAEFVALVGKYFSN